MQAYFFSTHGKSIEQSSGTDPNSAFLLLCIRAGYFNTKASTGIYED